MGFPSRHCCFAFFSIAFSVLPFLASLSARGEYSRNSYMQTSIGYAWWSGGSILHSETYVIRNSETVRCACTSVDYAGDANMLPRQVNASATVQLPPAELAIFQPRAVRKHEATVLLIFFLFSRNCDNILMTRTEIKSVSAGLCQRMFMRYFCF